MSSATNPRMGHYHRLTAGLLSVGYNYRAASLIAMRYLMGRTLFAGEQHDAAQVMVDLTGSK